jgi:hypothetical protein
MRYYVRCRGKWHSIVDGADKKDAEMKAIRRAEKDGDWYVYQITDDKKKYESMSGG